ncbi:YbjP/YqhG family protein [Pseudomonas sp. GCEP-101]|uniref:YbjP/YqhG family protein n=1 Tax=Pseudomonas sp. GCEP-101 TaxID=2974552 RepID=UPI00223ADDCC|nr:YbjP/YqhG family protein [Pseudomonas sp. GCEP-101]
MAFLRSVFALSLILLTLFDTSLAASTPAADTASAERFLRQVYASYSHDGPGVPNPALKEEDVYDASLLALMKADQDAADGEVGYLNGDPVCDCQDWGDLRIQTLTFAAADGDRLTASVTLKDEVTGEGKQLDLLLHHTAHGWRVEDFVNAEGSLAQNLRKSTQDLLQFKQDAAKP